MLPIGLTIQEISPGQWKICLSPTIAPPAGSVSETTYPSHEEALKAAKEGNYY